jgi:hypothetical protein
LSGRKSALTYLYAEKEQWDRFERAAMKWLRRYLDERSPTLKNFAKITASLAQRELDSVD